MTRRAEEPLERRDIQLYKGDWLLLQEILAPAKVSPTEFIRKLVRTTILKVKAKQRISNG